ncbi:hypothetical protein H9P43_004937 [Blastocladiella emersonii ATCC 22665]|nr:hypothetical protein H9P43_004937 [Blastocladiella emersonii ATCC 22665]
MAVTRTALRAALKARVPVIASPMFLVSGPALVTAACRAGAVGSFPTLNARKLADLDAWLAEITSDLAAARAKGESPAEFAVNLIVHKTNPRLRDDLALVAKYKVPVVITSLGASQDVIDAVHAYGGAVFHDVTNLRHAEKAVAAGVDGLIAVCAGAGGHAGPATPFALVPQLRARFPDTILIAGGAISDGRTVRAAQTLGADLAYMGTRFIATREAMSPDEYKHMLVTAKSGPAPSFLPTVYTDKISGVNANFLRDSLVRAGMDPDKLASADHVEEDFSKLNAQESKAWKDLWSAGHGVLNIHDIPTTKELVDRLANEYQLAVKDENTRLAQWTQ